MLLSVHSRDPYSSIIVQTKCSKSFIFKWAEQLSENFTTPNFSLLPTSVFLGSLVLDRPPSSIQQLLQDVAKARLKVAQLLNIQCAIRNAARPLLLLLLVI